MSEWLLQTQLYLVATLATGPGMVTHPPTFCFRELAKRPDVDLLSHKHLGRYHQMSVYVGLSFSSPAIISSTDFPYKYVMNGAHMHPALINWFLVLSEAQCYLCSLECRKTEGFQVFNSEFWTYKKINMNDHCSEMTIRSHFQVLSKSSPSSERMVVSNTLILKYP